jgi:hypothetical protein
MPWASGRGGASTTIRCCTYARRAYTRGVSESLVEDENDEAERASIIIVSDFV